MEIAEIRTRLQRARDDVEFWNEELTKRENELHMEQTSQNNIVSIVEIKNFIDKMYQCDISLTERKREPYVYARCVYAHLCREFTTASLDSIGTLIGRNHATIINSKNTFDDLYGTDYTFTKLAKPTLKEFQKLLNKKLKTK